MTTITSGSPFGPLSTVTDFTQSSAGTIQSGMPTLPRMTVTGHMTDIFGGFNGLMFQAMFETPFIGLPDDLTVEDPPIGGDDPIWFDPKLVIRSTQFFQQLPPEAQQALLSSPTVVAQLSSFLMGGGQIEFSNDLPTNTAGQFHPALNGEPNKILLDFDVLDALNAGEVYAVESFLGATSHELGHAMTHNAGFFPDTSSRDAYIASALRGEAYAVLNSMLVAHEYSNASMSDLRILSGENSGNTYEVIYQHFANNAGLDQLIDAVIAHMRSQSDGYEQYYADYYDQHYDG